MASGEVKVKIVGDTTGLKKATSEAESSLNKLSDTTKKVGAALGVAFGATAAVSFLKDCAAAAAEDEKSQKLLTLAITDNTSATASQIQQTEKWITATQNATGVMDEQLRPALALLVGATHDVGTAQQLMNTVLDISAARGLDVETVALAVTKAYNGATTGLSRMGIQIKDTSGKTEDFNTIMENANETFGGAAAAAADTASGRLAILSAKFEDMKEEIGNQVLPMMVAFESFILTRLIPVVANFAAGLPNVGHDLSTGVAVVLNNILGAFQGAVNAIISAANWAINAFNNLPGMGIVRNIAGHLGLGGGKVPTIPKVPNLGVTVPYYPTGLAMAGANAGLGGGGAAYDGSGAPLAIGGGATGPIAAAGGGGGGAKGGKTDAEKKKEADDKLIGEALKSWADARDNQRQIEDNMYDNELISYDQYKDILTKRLAVAVKGSDEWTEVQKRLTDVTKQYQDQQVKDAQDQADELKKISDQRLKDMEDALAKTQEIQDNEYKEGAISADEYLSILRGRLAGLEQFTNEWTAIFEEIKSVSSDAGYAQPSLGSVGAGSTNMAAAPGVNISGPVTVVANDPATLVRQLQMYDRQNGGVPISVR